MVLQVVGDAPQARLRQGAQHLGGGVLAVPAVHHELADEAVIEGADLCARLHPGVHPHPC